MGSQLDRFTLRRARNLKDDVAGLRLLGKGWCGNQQAENE
ncbi:hypothetical protein ESCAB7627_4060 [Escherichia albertii TW07627]|uniref:Uncharacterized protein n=1 Tax=Escherichia albertii (strain TW07627) TaxID=502347 RepID=A0ABC9NJE6_ESCAT|nr:hypothetical protein ESCAB7627_4060 [Escherichia albertii TW07627]